MTIDPTGPMPDESQSSWRQQRRERIIAEIQRNRRGEYKVPTWVLGLVLVAIIVAWALLIIFG